MAAYFILFFTTIVFSMAARCMEKTKHRVLFVLFQMLAVSLPLLFAGLRDESVGSDVRVYLKPVYLLAQRYQSLFGFLGSVKIEKGYAAWIWLVTRLSDRFFWVMLVGECLVFLPFYTVIWKLRDRVPLDLSLLTFFVVVYTHSLNTMRQDAAMAFIFLAFYYLTVGKYRKTALYTAVAVMLHYSAIVGIVLFLIYMAVKSKYKKLAVAGIVLLTPVGTLFYQQIFTFVVRTLTFLPQRYISASYLNQGSIDFPICEIVLAVIGFAVASALLANNRNGSREILFLFLTSLIAALTIFIGVQARYAVRSVWYFGMFNIIILSSGAGLFRRRTANYYLYKLSIVFILLFYWIKYFSTGYCSICPYVIS